MTAPAMHMPTESSSFGRKLFALYIFISVILPGGSILGINVKILTFVPLTLYGIQLLSRQREAISQVFFALMVAAVASFWLIPSLMNPFYDIWGFPQYKDVLTTLLGCLLVRLFTLDMVSREKFIRLCIYAVAFGSFLKVLLFLYSIKSGVSISDVIQRVSHVTGVVLMSVDIDGAGIRIQFPSDNVIPICVFAITALRKRLRIGALSSFLIVALFVTSSLFTFSRFIWVSTLFAFFLGMLLAEKDRMRWVYLGVAGAVTLYFISMITDLIELRFASSLATASDQVRAWQIAKLKEFFWQAPLFGHGMGSYPIHFKRSEEVFYAYEVQVLALFGEFGLVGMGLFVLLMVNYYRKAFSFSAGTSKYQFAIFLLLLNYLAAGFFNPCLLVSFSAVSYGLIFALAGMHRTEGSSSSKATFAEPLGRGFPDQTVYAR
ncbi:O-antigen ligase family protein [Terriglobus roseus]